MIKDVPTVLGWERWEALERQLSYQSLKEGIEIAIQSNLLKFDCNVDMANIIINGALNAIVLCVGAPDSVIQEEEWHAAIRFLFRSFSA